MAERAATLQQVAGAFTKSEHAGPAGAGEARAARRAVHTPRAESWPRSSRQMTPQEQFSLSCA